MSKGSSPRMRGKQTTSLSVRSKTGLIPAHAGKTGAKQGNQVRKRAHPRACGENPAATTEPTQYGGSSPRMRGKPIARIGYRDISRLIPAHAGKTASATLNALRAGAHPRACGENRRGRVFAGQELGSSPRMRGKLEGESRGRRESRLIPAHAGKTSS